MEQSIDFAYCQLKDDSKIKCAFRKKITKVKTTKNHEKKVDK